MKILYADDDKVIQKIVVYNLIKYDHEVTTVDNGKEAVETIDTEDFDLIILDVIMPKLSGIEVLEHIRKEKNDKTTPVIMISRDAHFSTKKKAKLAGANEYITKPFTPEDLYLKIKKLTGHTAG